ncbi:NAD(P)H-dependent oxidoreductase [Haoranjiania flava]|uniref:NAD(P)H-dependent oxidoreductase n=1 Tax=Haoranjiania flava TaxID=1856322 RepID=A0AAE3LP46_9BACT|nr:NAD(P)H-dependent oxidoreductase [Haoranjiania flava]MCU7693120.1 NAD(P)H-dependent oxidoreductase [Haoranjiania flava]
MNVLVILGHPRKESYCGALAEAYTRGAEEAGAHVKRILIADMQFEKNVLAAPPEEQFLEPDILKAKDLITWANHLVFIYPTWWGSVPSLLKAFLERTIIPGFAFRELQFDAYEKKLSPRTAQLITTMDTPLFVYKLFYGSPGTKALTNATLKFCGVSPVRKMHISPVKHSTRKKKEQWLEEVYHTGRALQYGVLTPWEKLMKRINPWIQAVRLQFYPMTFFAYSAGAFAAAFFGHTFNMAVFLLGYILLFLFEVAVVFSNEYHDKETDRLNRFYSPFTGGSRVLVNGLISDEAIKKATRNVLAVCFAITALVAYLSSAPYYVSISLIMILFVIAISYTVPPVKFSYNGMGEMVVGFTHSFAMILCGFVFQGGSLGNSYPWLLSLPLFLSIVPAIIMAGMPDYFADKAAGKGTLAVRFGKSKATGLAIVFVLLATSSAIFLKLSGYLDEAYGNSIYLTIIHAVLLVKMLYTFMRKKDKPDRIDAIMAVSLMYIMWYALIPFIKLM